MTSDDNYTQEEQQYAYNKRADVKVELLVRILKMIDLVSNRGTFKGQELAFVGTIYDSVLAGVEMAMKQSKKELKERAASDMVLQQPQQYNPDINSGNNMINIQSSGIQRNNSSVITSNGPQGPQGLQGPQGQQQQYQQQGQQQYQQQQYQQGPQRQQIQQPQIQPQLRQGPPIQQPPLPPALQSIETKVKKVME
jgi:hypothetical protein